MTPLISHNPTPSLSPVPPPPEADVDGTRCVLLKLPTELLKHIVELVRMQDQAWMSDGTRRRGIEELSRYDEEDDSIDSVREGEDVDVSQGRWGAAYGEGVQSLSRVNKVLRSMALPILFEVRFPPFISFSSSFPYKYNDRCQPYSQTITGRQLESSFCHFHIVGSPLANLITRLDLSRASEHLMLEIARSLPLLSSLKELIFSTTSVSPFLDLAPSDVRPEWKVLYGTSRINKKEEVVHREHARQALHGILGRISSLHVVGGPEDDVSALLRKPALPSKLERLHLSEFVRIFASPDAPLAQRLQRLDLRILSIDRVVESHAFWISNLRLPTLEVLEAPPDFLGEATLLTLPSIAPNLSTLILRPASDYHYLAITSPVPASSTPSSPFPVLRYLSLSLLNFHKASNPLPQIFAFFSTSPRLRALDLTLSRLNSPLRQTLPPQETWPPSLRRLRVRIVSASRLPDDEALRIELAEQGIELEVCWTPSKHYDTYSDEEERESTAIKSDCEWALRRIEMLQKTGDRAGMEELVETLGLLRQRRIIEEQ
jgi:hypothetical protein